MLLEGGFALGQPAGDFEESGWVLAAEREDGVYEGVGFDEGSVEIDAKGNYGMNLFGMGVALGSLDGDLFR